MQAQATPSTAHATTGHAASQDGAYQLVVTSRHDRTLDQFRWEARVNVLKLDAARRIESVEYVFPDVVRRTPVQVTDAASNYRLASDDYGVYKLTARVHLVPTGRLAVFMGKTTVTLTADLPWPRPQERTLPESLRFSAQVTQVNTHRYKFDVVLEGRPVQGLEVREVEYTLHPTFAHPVRRSRDASTRFGIADVCYGGFTINARVLFADGSVARKAIPIDPAFPVPMNFQTYYQHLENNAWRVHVWLRATPEELARVKSVSYTLHPTFRPSQVVATDSTNMFVLSFTTWGSFRLTAQVETRSGEFEVRSIDIRPGS